MASPKTLDSLAVIGEARPTVRRDGVAGEVSTSEIVLDDVIEIGPGGAGLRIMDGSCVEADGLEIDESLLTGEADPVVKHVGDEVMSGSFVVAGGGAFTATKVGREAYAAQLAEEASRFTLVHSELRSGISTILKYVTWMMIPTAIGLVISQLVVKQHGFKDSIARTVGGIVPMVPEGLVLLTSVAFAIGVIRLGRRTSASCRNFPPSRASPASTPSASTRPAPSPRAAWTSPSCGPIQGADETYIRKALGALGESDPRPNASLQAIINSYPDSEDWRCTESLPFSSARKYSGASFSEGNGESSTWLLGAPDVLLPDGDPALAETARLNKERLRVLLLAKASKDLDDLKVTGGTAPPPWWSWSSGCARTPRNTLRYSPSRT